MDKVDHSKASEIDLTWSNGQKILKETVYYTVTSTFISLPNNFSVSIKILNQSSPDYMRIVLSNKPYNGKRSEFGHQWDEGSWLVAGNGVIWENDKWIDLFNNKFCYKNNDIVKIQRVDNMITYFINDVLVPYSYKFEGEIWLIGDIHVEDIIEICQCLSL